ncbi:BatA domain-containing protein [Pedobacter jamesrossensis]|uniref:BatA domain-containing protein n=1 Tax=Pedobacter jamesrossensis TaxID=1908238 RepID=A0ABV8NIF5_9SPHI
MQLLYPIGLLALAGLIIPLIIHLWNVKESKTLKIGSISLLGASARTSSKSFRITDWLLFILRCLLVILIAFLLTQPYIRKTINSKNKGGWILVEKSKFPEVFKNNRKQIDSLIKINYEIHDFNLGFDLLTLKDTIAPENRKQANEVKYSALISEINSKIPSGSSVYLYANQPLNQFDDELPSINYKLNWKPINQTDTISNWITQFADKKYEAKSTPSSVYYNALNNENTSVISVTIYDETGNDAKYIKAALNAISSFSKRKIEINQQNKSFDVGFWLSEKAVSNSFKNSIKAGGSLFEYETGKIISEKSIINTEAGSVDLNKRLTSAKPFTKLWTDGFGNSILSEEKKDRLNILHFYSRLNPQWNDLVWNEIFVKTIMPIVITDKKNSDFGFEDNLNDQRKMPLIQTENIEINKGEKQVNITTDEPVNYIFWTAALLILALERILSFRKKPGYVKN